MNQELLTQKLAALPLFQFEWIETRELTFSQRIRHICKTECPMYGTTWACPPAVGSVEDCRARCLSYPRALMITSDGNTTPSVATMPPAMPRCF